jgi:hypothetical protein
MSGNDIQDGSEMPGGHKIGQIAKMKKTSIVLPKHMDNIWLLVYM